MGHAIFVPLPFRNFRSIRVKVAAELVASETEVVAEKAELFAVEPDGTVGEGLGDGAVDFFQVRNDDILVAAVGAICGLDTLQHDV